MNLIAPVVAALLVASCSSCGSTSSGGPPSPAPVSDAGDGGDASRALCCLSATAPAPWPCSMPPATCSALGGPCSFDFADAGYAGKVVSCQ